MRRIVSVSIGSSKRDHKAVVNVRGEDFSIERIGTDGDMEKAKDLLEALDGKVAVFGMGGIGIYFWGGGGRRLILRAAKPLASIPQITPIVDGSGAKDTLERRTIEFLTQQDPGLFRGKRVLLTSAVDRFGMAQALHGVDCQVLYGDLIFILGLPVPIYSLKLLETIVTVLAPLVVQAPYSWLYPTGSEQEKVQTTSKYRKYYEWADIIAGDYHLIHKYMLDDMKGKTIITNTVTEDDVQWMIKRNVGELITTTPNFQGRSYGTNVIEALMVALLDKPIEEITDADYYGIIDELGFTPRKELLNTPASPLEKSS
jgi:hypothetical protein